MLARLPNYLDLHAARLGVDLADYTTAAKLYGPKQSGALYAGAQFGLASTD